MGKKLYVGNLSYQTTDEDLEQFFSQFGSVVSARTMKDRETGQARGFGFVEMSTDAQAQAAIAGANGKSLGGRALRVNEAEDKPRPGGGGQFGNRSRY